jgi:hypothetical protein
MFQSLKTADRASCAFLTGFLLDCASMNVTSDENSKFSLRLSFLNLKIDWIHKLAHGSLGLDIVSNLVKKSLGVVDGACDR